MKQNLKKKAEALVKRDRLQDKASKMLKRDHLLGIMESAHLTWARQKIDYLLKNHETIFKNCKTYGDTRRVLQEFDKTELMTMIDSILAKANLCWSQEQVKCLVQEGIFAGCKNRDELVDVIEHLVITESICDLISEAGLNWPKEYAENLALDYTNVFYECENRAEAIQRLLEIAPAITIA